MGFFARMMNMPHGYKPEGQVRERCPQGHSFAYVTSRDFGWCRTCQRYSPVTLEAECCLPEMKRVGNLHHAIDKSFLVGLPET